MTDNHRRLLRDELGRRDGRPVSVSSAELTWLLDRADGLDIAVDALKLIIENYCRVDGCLCCGVDQSLACTALNKLEVAP